MKKLIRSRRYRMIAGVCGGIGQYFDIDPTIIRVSYVLLSILTVAFPGLILYLLLWMIIPNAEKEGPLV